MGHIITVAKNDINTKAYIAIENNHFHIYVEDADEPKISVVKVKDAESAIDFLKKEPNSRFLEL